VDSPRNEAIAIPCAGNYSPATSNLAAHATISEPQRASYATTPPTIVYCTRAVGI
jgi:hypothetical protein